MKAVKNDQKVLCENRKALFLYEIVDKFEAGLVLLGYEVKALYEGKGNIKGSYISLASGKPIIRGFHIGRYSKCSIQKIDKDRDKELLLNKKEIAKLQGQDKSTGQTVVPLNVYIKNGLIKMEIALVRGKKNFEKKQKIKERDVERNIKRKLGKI